MSETNFASHSIERELIHVRNLKLCGYQRADGLWDIEARLVDTRTYDSTAVERDAIKAGDSVHDLWVCVTVDNHLTVQAIHSSMDAHPFDGCQNARHSLDKLRGAVLGPGWRNQIDMHVGGHRGCTHIREMLLQVATTAYQTIPVWFAQKEAGGVMPVLDGKPPRHLGQCHGWALDGAIVGRLYPQFASKRNAENDR